MKWIDLRRMVPVAVAIGIVSVFLIADAPPVWQAVVTYVGIAAGLLWVVVGLRRHRPATGVSAVLLTGVTLNAIATLVWWAPTFAGGEPLPQPSVADAIWLLYGICFAATFVSILGRRERPLVVVLDTLTIAIVVGLIAGVALIAPDFAASAIPLKVRLTQVAYVVTDVILISAVLRVLVAPRGRPVALWLLTAGAAGLVLSDVAWNWLTLAGTYAPGTWADAGWALAPLLTGLAVLHPSIRRAGALDRRDVELRSAGPLLLGAASLAAPLVLASHGLLPDVMPDVDDSTGSSIAVLAGGALLSGLVVTRFMLLLRRARQLADKAVARLDQSEAQYRGLVEQIPGIVVVFGLAGGIRPLYISPQCREILGVAPDEWMAGFHQDRWVPLEDRERLAAAFERTIATGVVEPVEFRFRRPDGEEIWLRDVGAQLVDRAEGPCLQGLLFDVTAAKRAEVERERMELELRLSQKLEAVGQLAAGIAHEINTPIQFVGDTVRFLQEAFDDLMALTAVQAELQAAAEAGAVTPALLDRARDACERADVEYLTERVPAALERGIDGIRRVADIVRAMREFAYPPGMTRAPVDLNAALNNTLIVAANTYKYVADVELDLEDLPPVVCDGGDINQVLLNLVVNGAQAIEEQIGDSHGRGLIRLATRRDGDDVVISVGDSGGGIPADIATRVFDPFFTTKEVGRGTGQGLAISRTIVVERHGGSLTFESEPGRGTTFHIRLPIGAVEEAKVAA